MNISVATTVTADDISYNQYSAGGIFGFGPRSPLMSAYLNIYTNQSSYSIAINK